MFNHPTDWTTSLGFIANIISNIAYVPQIIKSYKRKKVEDLSFSMFIILFITQICWICYSIPLHATQLWTSSAVELLLLLPILAMFFIYKQRKPDKFIE